MSDIIVEFAASVGVMKPNVVKKDDDKAKKRLDTLLDSAEYAAEEKIDGCRYKLIGDRFFSSDNVEKTDNFPHLRNFFTGLRMKNLVLDGEIHYPGKTSQYATHVTGAKKDAAIHFQNQNGNIHYTIFDLLRTPKANWTLQNTYKERRRLLEYFYKTFIADTPLAEFIHLAEVRYTDKREYIQELLDKGLEGAVLKKLDSKYAMGKKPMWQWMKIKQEDDTDLVIMGFDPPTKEYKGKNLSTWPYWLPEYEGSDNMIPVSEPYYRGQVGSVVLGAYVDGVLTKICTAAGLSNAMRQQMTDNPDAFIGKVARVTFMELTTDGYPRHPAFKNMHEGKLPEECTWTFK